MDTEFNLTKAMSAAKVVREAIAALRNKRDDLRNQIEKLKSKNEELLSMPVGRDDAKQFMFETIDQVASQYRGWERPFADYAFPRGVGRRQEPRTNVTRPYDAVAPLSLRDIEQVRESNSGYEAVFGSEAKGFSFSSGLAAFYFLFGDLLKERIEEEFEQLFPRRPEQDQHDGSTAAERRATIEQNNELISRLREEIWSVERQIADFGGRM